MKFYQGQNLAKQHPKPTINKYQEVTAKKITKSITF